MTFAYTTGDVIAFGFLLICIIAILVMMGIVAVNVFVRKIGKAFDNAFQFNQFKEREQDGAPASIVKAVLRPKTPATSKSGD